jgi:predicted unusual protein kinase regulating ubiquinone biosynthesis (AarF/ABC1/UbiB family)
VPACGLQVTDEAALASHGVDKDALVAAVCAAFAHCVHVDGHFSGDPHPGNILVRPRPGGAGGGQAVLLDWGLAKTLSTRSRLALSRVVHGVSSNDIALMLQGFEDVGVLLGARRPADKPLAGGEGVLRGAARARSSGGDRAGERARRPAASLAGEPL